MTAHTTMSTPKAGRNQLSSIRVASVLPTTAPKTIGKAQTNDRTIVLNAPRVKTTYGSDVLDQNPHP